MELTKMTNNTVPTTTRVKRLSRKTSKVPLSHIPIFLICMSSCNRPAYFFLTESTLRSARCISEVGQHSPFKKMECLGEGRLLRCRVSYTAFPNQTYIDNLGPRQAPFGAARHDEN